MFVTAYPKHEALIGLFSEFGFQNVEQLGNGELVLAKSFASRIVHDIVSEAAQHQRLERLRDVTHGGALVQPWRP